VSVTYVSTYVHTIVTVLKLVFVKPERGIRSGNFLSTVCIEINRFMFHDSYWLYNFFRHAIQINST